MKSAYELAMERLNKTAPARKLSADQKARIAELESIYKAKVAERELATTDEVAAAESAGDFRKAETIREQLTRDRKRFEEELEAKKEKVRAES
jgi:hypothetical protein